MSLDDDLVRRDDGGVASEPVTAPWHILDQPVGGS
jgi:hypothetical protein